MSTPKPSRGPKPTPVPPPPRQTRGVSFQRLPRAQGPGSSATAAELRAQARAGRPDPGIAAAAKIRRGLDFNAGVPVDVDRLLDTAATASMVADRSVGGPTDPPRPHGGIGGAISDD